jgi:alkylhydroperoxidase/carboxymuconolactone decarboxylase family protein YurZ
MRSVNTTTRNACYAICPRNERSSREDRSAAMENLAEVITSTELASLRAGYDRQAFLGANQNAFVDAYPPLASWIQATSKLLYAEGPISAQQRELCLITLLAFRAPGLALATHVYWGLMEGLHPEQVCHAASLAGCYGGFPTLGDALVAIKRTFAVLKRLAGGEASQASSTVLAALVREFANVTL